MIRHYNYMHYGIIISLIIHALIGAGLYFSRVETGSRSVPDLIEIINYGVEQARENGNNISNPSGIRDPKQSERTGSRSNTAPDNINLPKSSSDSPEEIINNSGNEPAWSNIETEAEIGNTRKIVESGLKESAVSPLVKPEGETVSIDASEDFLTDLKERLAGKEAQSSGYTLSGEVVSRKIVEKVIPEYPSGLQQDSEVQLKFEVLPNGKVKNSIIIIKKGGPELDAVSLEALKKWRFNAISSELIQTGLITFRYELE